MTVQQDREQLFLELINRARLDPAAEALRYGLVDLSAGTGTTITTDAKQPLAFNALLLASATAHDTYLIANDVFSHTGSGNSNPGDRMVAAGYGTAGTFGWGENLAWAGTTGVLDANAEVPSEHQGLFLSAGHRANMLNPLYEEVGISALTDANYMGYSALVTTHNFAYKLSTPIFVTGVNYTDADNNDFYSIGESAAGRTVQIYNGGTLLGTTTTAAAGGYQLQIAANQTIEMVFSAGGLAAERGAAFAVGSVNVKVDLTDGTTIESNVSTTLTRQSQNLTLLSIDNVNGTGNTLDNVIKGNKGNNTLDGGLGDDTLLGGDGTDILLGGSGNDTLDGGTGSDTAQFGGTFASYAFSYNAATATYSVYGADGAIDTVTGVETFVFADGTYTAGQLPLGAGAPLRTASISAAQASAAEGNGGGTAFTFFITLNATVFAPQTVAWSVAGTGLNPANAADFTSALSGTVTFLPGETSKQVTVMVGGDTAAEADETFTVSLGGPSSGLVLGTVSAQSIIVNDDAPAVTQITGTAGKDVLNGTANADVMMGLGDDDFLNGSAGADVLDGGAGTDRADYSASASAVFVNLATNINTGGDAAGDTLTSIELVIGSAFNDTLVGDAQSNIFFDGAGNDVVSTGGENDYVYGGEGADQYDGGAGTVDFLSYSLSTAGVTVNLSTNINTGGFAQGDTVVNFERIYGSAYNDSITGDGQANTLYGYSGDDTLNGMAGDDLLLGGDGADTLLGGYGTDALDGGAGNDNLSGGDGADSLEGGAGADTLTGDAGVDTATYTTSTAGVTVDLATNVNTGGDAQGDILTGIENVTGSAWDDTLSGNDAANTLTGGTGRDTLRGMGGDDTLIGGLGADVLDGGAGTDRADYSASAAAVSVNLATNINTGGDAAGDTLTSVELIIGSAFNDTLVGDGLSNIIFDGAGNDIVNTGGDNDYVYGGEGADQYDGGAGTVDFLSYSLSTAGVTVNLTTNINTGGFAQGDTITNFERIYGSAYADFITGDGQANTLYGFSGNDTLNGMAGDDLLLGGDGDDFLQGGLGADVLDGGAGTDRADYSASATAVSVNLATNINTGGDAAGDTLTSIELIIGSAFNDTLVGDGLSNIIFDGAGNDIVNTGGDNDYVYGGEGADQYDGGAGTVDFLSYSLSTAGVTVNLTTNINTGGFAQGDTVVNFERIYGSAYTDSITGDGQANTLYGFSGNDTLNGMAGDDLLLGGDGADTFVLSTPATGTDTILDFEKNLDHIQFTSNLGITFGMLVFAGQGTSQVTITGFDGASTLIVNAAAPLTLTAGDFLFA